jgi:methylated-DNA-[protein]-cysteine S-methyltransferase
LARPGEDAPDAFLGEVERQVRAYLAGGLRRLELPYILPAQPAFCHKLWREAQNIPYGQVLSYGALAARAHNPRAARAAGYAMSINRLFLIVPCHRVIAAGAKLGGYGGRPDLKARLLSLEGLRVEEGRVLPGRP